MRVNRLTRKWFCCTAIILFGAQYAPIASAMEEPVDLPPGKSLLNKDPWAINDFYQLGETYRQHGDTGQALACYLESNKAMTLCQDSWDNPEEWVEPFFKNWSYEALYVFGNHLRQQGDPGSPESALANVLFSILNERDSHELKENIYTLYHLESGFNLLEPVCIGGQENPENDSIRERWRFFPIEGREKEMIFRIQNLETAHYIKCTHRQNTLGILFLSDPDKEDTEFYWQIKKYPDRSTFKICPYGKHDFQYLFYNENQKIGFSQGSVEGFDQGSIWPWEWTFNPWYGASGNIDFSQIVKDLGPLLVSRYKGSFPELGMTATIDMTNLTARCAEVTHLTIDRNNANYQVFRREIFRSTDHSELLRQEGSRVTISREIKTEDVLQTSLSRSLEQADISNVNDTTRRARNRQDAQASENERHSTDTILKAITSLLKVNVVDHTEESKKKGTSSSHATHESETDHKETMNSEGRSETHHTSERTTEGKNRHVSGTASASVSAKAGFLGSGVGVKAGVSVTGGGGSHSETSRETSHGTTTTSERREMESRTKTRGSETVNGSTQEDEDRRAKTNEVGTEESKLTQGSAEQGQRDLTSTQQIEGNEEEATHNRVFTMESRRNMTTLTSQTKKTEEKWYIERQLIQAHHSRLEVVYYEEDVEVANYPFEVEIRLSGTVGFPFNQRFGTGNGGVVRSTKDILKRNSWYLTPATIIQYLPAPGFVAQSDGSVIYKARGTLNLKKPIRVYSAIHEKPLATQPGMRQSPDFLENDPGASKELALRKK